MKREASPRLIVRPARPEDAGRIAAVNAEGVPGVTPMLAAEAAQIMREATWFVVAELDGRVCGYLMAYAPGTDYQGEEYLWFKERSADFFYVDQIAVSESARGMGVGRALYDEAARTARSRGLSALVCEINIDPPNQPSMDFHHRLGFSEIDRLKVRLYARCVALMRRPLSRA